MISQILAAIATIREIISTVKSIISFVEAVREERWFKDWTDLKQDLANAKTAEERKAIARRIRDSLASI